MRGYGTALSSVLLVSLAQLMLRAAMLQMPPWQTLTFSELWQHPQPLLLLCAGLAAYGISMLCWVLALRHLALSRLYPLLSLSYVLVWLTATAMPWNNEPFHWSSLAGIALIMTGLRCIYHKRPDR